MSFLLKKKEVKNLSPARKNTYICSSCMKRWKYMDLESIAEQFTNATSPARWNDSEPWGPKRDPLVIVVPVTILYSLIFVTGVVGNVSTCVVISRNRHMHTATNYYLFSLAISDLLLLLSGLPPEMYSVWSKYPYIFGETFCILSGLAAETSSNATVLTITAFTVERYVAICHPFLTHTVSKLSRAVKFVLCIWITAISCAIPLAMQQGLVYLTDEYGRIVSEEYKICALKRSYPYAFEVSTIVFFFLPMSVITVLYLLIGLRLHRSTTNRPCGSSQRLRDSRRTVNPKSTARVVKMLVVVVVAFFICWAPFQAQRLVALYGYMGDDTSPKMILIFKAITYVSGLLYYLSTTVNPFLYNIMSLKFREAFKNTLTQCCKRKDGVRSDIGGCSSGAIGLGGACHRFNYSVLSHRSLLNANHRNVSCNNNNSCSSGNSSSYIESVDLNRRPLVVSFRRNKMPGNSTSSLEFRSPEKRELLHIPQRDDSFSHQTLTFNSFHHRSPALSLKRYDAYSTAYRDSSLQTPPVDKFPRIEDIEIFQECQSRISRRERSKRSRSKGDKASTVFFSSEGSKKSPNGKDDDDSMRSDGVKKSYTLPCLMID